MPLEGDHVVRMRNQVSLVSLLAQLVELLCTTATRQERGAASSDTVPACPNPEPVPLGEFSTWKCRRVRRAGWLGHTCRAGMLPECLGQGEGRLHCGRLQSIWEELTEPLFFGDPTRCMPTQAHREAYRGTDVLGNAGVDSTVLHMQL